MSACIFCKIVRKELPSCIVAEEENVLAFMDIMPARKGHVLVTPKRHAEGMLDVAGQDLAACLQMVQRICVAMQEAVHPPGFSVVQLNGAAAGQTVFHIHFHIIPRQAGDGIAMKWSHETYAPGEIEQYREKIAGVLKAQTTKLP